MDDKTMLEMAAKACGAYWFGHYGCWYLADKPWNPLTDDGDALRLAVKLRILVDVTRFATTAIANGDIHAAEKHNGDPYAATRRAIVRAAAAIAKQGEGE